MFLDRTEEARAIYMEFRDLRNYMGWSAVVLAANHFQIMRNAGLVHPLMDEIEKLR